MRNGFGLKFLHKFFNLPFLQLQKETLLKQLERNETETQVTIQELDLYIESDEANYSKFMENITRRRREIADSNANIPAPATPISQSLMSQNLNSSSPITNIKRSQSASIIIGGGKPIPFGGLNGASTKKSSAIAQLSKSSSLSAGFKDGVLDIKKNEMNSIVSVEEFCPDGGQIDRNFLDDVQTASQVTNTNVAEESDR